MKHYYSFIIAAALLVLSACGQNQTATEKVIDNTNDALDQRPNEKMRDAVEDTSDGIKGVGKDIKEKIKDATN